MSKINKLNDRQLKKAGHMIVKEPVYVNETVINIPPMKANARIFFRNIRITRDHQHER